MTDIAVQKTSVERPRPPARETWDPFQAMRELMRSEPFGPGWFAPVLSRTTDLFSPSFEVKESKDSFEFKADVPGIEAKDLEVKLANNRLTISGKREAEKTEKGETFYTCERSYGSFTRTFTVPEGVNGDAVQADLKDGVLKVVLPKKPEAKPREVQIKSQ